MWDRRVIFLNEKKKKKKRTEDAGAFQHVAPESSSHLVSVSDGGSFPFANENPGHGVIPAPREPNTSAVCASHPALKLQLLEYLFYSPLFPGLLNAHRPFFMMSDESSHCV